MPALNGNQDLFLTIVFGLAALLYLALATRVSRAAVGPSNRAISSFLFLIGLMVAGSAFSHNTANANLYGIGRTLAVFSSSFLPLMFNIIYREFTIGRPSVTVLVTLSIVPVMSVLLAGGGLPVGQIIGASDAKGSVPKERPYRPEDVLHTMYAHLGIDPAMTFPDNSGRPRYVLERRHPIIELA